MLPLRLCFRGKMSYLTSGKRQFCSLLVIFDVFCGDMKFFISVLFILLFGLFAIRGFVFALAASL